MQQVNWAKLSPAEQQQALARNPMVSAEGLADVVAGIIAKVREQGDAALLELGRQFDSAELSALTPSEDDWAAAEQIPSALKAAIEQAIANIRSFHAAQRLSPMALETQPGVRCELRVEAIDKVGLYVPGGSAPLISTVLMLAVPAQIAQCRQVVLTTPAPIDPAILYAAKACGVTQVIAAGGAQAVAALAYGTESVAKVDKIFGPGNRFVTEAKRQVSQDAAGAAIDMPAGPSEVLVIADASANPAFVASDLLSQAEHGEDSQVILVSDSQTLIDSAQVEIASQLSQLPRKAIAEQALAQSRSILVDDLAQAVQVSNAYAPEHLIIQTQLDQSVLAQVRAAGSVFVGPYTPESVGDYASGTNHVLPTYGFSKTVSSLSLADFQRRFTVQSLSAQGLQNLGECVMTLADAEGLDAHKNAVAIRLASLQQTVESQL
ncbi:histidinol dehydrogenase [Paraferrimonas sedimenticola]|uniref:Histidinol dehydrogenase n=1 Tax=Paraferrimonas sedimenticola TaxID=375674 RepID=A0AA37RWM1_9GAMM|nr:histidinol dehydrogenase [Paraferrimonas sedimenticola]GLP96513.1 histidinol dehydrogenase [Paraferrimonas sedimenticola]